METPAIARRDEIRALCREVSEFRIHIDRRFAWLGRLMIAGFIITIASIAGAFWGVLQFVR